MRDGHVLPHRIVVMGVAGCGKTRIGKGLARKLDLPFVEGDTYHSEANVAKMRDGIPLTDDDRRDWLEALATVLRTARERDAGVVVSCSALRRRYRDVLRGGSDDVRFVYLRGRPEVFRARLQARRGHFMPASLLDSQFATLEEPDADERAIIMNTGSNPHRLIDLLANRFTRVRT